MWTLITIGLFMASLFYAGYETGKLDQKLRQEIEMSELRNKILLALSKKGDDASN